MNQWALAPGLGDGSDDLFRDKQRIQERGTSLSKKLCWVAALFPCATAVGWWFGIPALTHVVAGLPAMQPNTAVGLLLCATAIHRLADPRANSTIPAMLGSLVMLGGLLTLSEYGFGWDLGIDQVFGPGGGTPGQSFPGRPSPQASANFVLLGAATLAYSVQRIRAGQAFALMAAANSLVALTGYVFGTAQFYGFPMHEAAIGIAVHTGITFLILVTALLGSRPMEGMMSILVSDTRSGTIARRIVFFCLVMPPVIGKLTTLGVRADWYGVDVQFSLFVIVLMGLLLWLTWRVTRRSEREEMLLRRSQEEREQLMQQLERERRWLGAVFEDAPIGMVMVRAKDPEHSIPNRQARTYFGAEPDGNGGSSAVLGRACDAQGRPLSDAELACSRVMRGETIQGVEQRVCFTDGREIPIMTAGGPIHDDAGEWIGAVAFFQDISALKELERLREEGAAIIAHDLRQPITAIQMQAEVLGHMPDANDRVRRLAELVASSAAQLNRMTHDLLDVSRIEAQRLDLQLGQTDVAGLIRKIAEKLQPLYPESPIQVEVAGAVDQVQCDEGRLEQVIGNLISNAARYGSPGAEISVRLSQAADRVRIAITNHGKGIEADELKQLFQRFQRTQQGKREGIKGIGLGLYIAKGLVEAHGGRIQVESVPGETTTFTIDLPVSGPVLKGPDPG